jgi:hypothetical protein
MPTDPNDKPRRRLAVLAVAGALAAGALLGTAAASSGVATGNPTPTEPSTTTPGTTTTGPIPSIPNASQVIILPSNHKCVTNLYVQIRHPSGLKFRSLAAFLAGHRHGFSKSKSSFTLKHLPKGQFTLGVTAVTTTHRSLSVSRRYHRCS